MHYRSAAADALLQKTVVTADKSLNRKERHLCRIGNVAAL